MAARRKGRIIAFQALYSWAVNSSPLDSLLRFEWLEPEKVERLGEAGLAFPRLIIAGTIEHIAEIDELIKQHLINWDFSRVSKVDLAILRMSVFSLLYQKDIPSTIVIDEAIDISKEYSANDSFRFINGVLDGVKKTLLAK